MVFHYAWADAPGGILENVTNAQTRPRLTPAEIAAFMPSRGEFTFPPPWNTTGVRLTNASDCGGNDCLWYVGYSYWSNINNSTGSDTMYILLGLNRDKGGSGPTLFQFNKVTGQVTKVGPLFPSDNSLSYSTAEGWYFSPTDPNTIYLNQGGQLLRHNVATGQSTVAFDLIATLDNLKTRLLNAGLISTVGGLLGGVTGVNLNIDLGGNLNVSVVTALLNLLDTDGLALWQTHTSHDGLVHSATVQDAVTNEFLGCTVYREDNGAMYYFPKEGAFDECQIDKSGRWLLIKEDQYNRIEDLANNSERILTDAEGSVGHSDMGFGYMIGEDNQATDANTWKLWLLDQNPLSGLVTYHNNDWTVDAPNHVSHTNARSDIPASEQYVCGSSANRINSPESNEVICFRLNNSGDVLVAAPVMTDLDAVGGGDSDYAKQPKGNLDPTGQYFIWTSNLGGSRLDAFLVKVPYQLFDAGTSSPSTGGSGSTDTTPPVITVTGSNIQVDTATFSWTTDEVADSRVEYGPTTARDFATARGPFSTSHVQQLTGLQPGTTYHYVLASTDSSGNLATTPDNTFTTAASAPTGPNDVTWGTQVNTTTNNGTLTKTGGCDGCADAWAYSDQQILAGDGYLQFTANEASLLRVIGLASEMPAGNADKIDFAIRLQAGMAEVHEAGAYLAETSFVAGDTFRIEISGNTISYLKNGSVFFSHAASITYPLNAVAVLFNLNATISNAIVDDTDRNTGALSAAGCDDAVFW